MYRRDWEPYHFRAPHTNQSQHGLPHSPMGNIGSGGRAERYARGGEYARDRDRGGEDGDGVGSYGGVMRDGGLANTKREVGGR
jgi:hypothetical protein